MNRVKKPIALLICKNIEWGDVGNDEIIPKSYIYSNEEYSIGTVKSVSEISRKL